MGTGAQFSYHVFSIVKLPSVETNGDCMKKSVNHIDDLLALVSFPDLTRNGVCLLVQCMCRSRCRWFFPVCTSNILSTSLVGELYSLVGRARVRRKNMSGHYGQLSVPDAGMYNVGGLYLIWNSNLIADQACDFCIPVAVRWARLWYYWQLRLLDYMYHRVDRLYMQGYDVHANTKCPDVCFLSALKKYDWPMRLTHPHHNSAYTVQPSENVGALH